MAYRRPHLVEQRLVGDPGWKLVGDGTSTPYSGAANSSAVRLSGKPFMLVSVRGLPVPSSILPEKATSVLISV